MKSYHGGAATFRVTMTSPLRVPVKVDDPTLDGILQHLIAAFESAFPGRRLGYYLIGSWAEGETNALSDIDVAVVWTRDAPTEGDRARGEAVLASLASGIRLDVAMLAESEVPSSLIGVNLKLSSRLIHGVDIRDRLPLPPLADYTESVKEGAHYFIWRVLRGTNRLSRIDYPDPDDEFFGYATKRIEAWYPPNLTCGLKEWVSTATRIARALLALQRGEYVGSTSAAIASYCALIADGWADYLDLLYRKGRIEWAYRVPEAEADREMLRDLCRRFLGFERHFLTIAGEPHPN